MLATLLPITALLFAGLWDLHRNEERQARRALLRSVQSALEGEAHRTYVARRVLGILAKRPEVSRGETHAVGDLLREILASDHHFENLALVSPAGEVLATAAGNDTRASVADRAYFLDALARDSFSRGEYVKDRVTGKAALAFACPVRGERGEVRFLLVAGLSLERSEDIAVNGLLFPESDLALLGARGTVFFRNHTESSNREPPPAEVLAALPRERQEGVEILEDANGEDHLYAFTRLAGRAEGRGALLFAGVPGQVAFAQSDRLFAGGILLSLLSLLFALAVARIVSDRLLLRPIDALLRATRRLAMGDLSARTALVGGGDEIGLLARSFDEMAASLENSRADIGRYSDRLETLHRIDREILRTRGPSAIAETALRHLRRLIPCDRACVVAFDAPRQEARVLSFLGAHGSEILDATPLALQDYLRIFRGLERNEREENDWADKDATLGKVLAALATEGFPSFVSLPLLAEGELVGSLDLWAAEAGRLSAKNAEVAQEVADQLAIAIRQAQLREDLERSEERFRGLVSNIPGVVFRCQPDEKFTPLYLSEEFESFSGLPPADFLEGRRNLLDLVHTEDRASFEESLRKSISDDSPFLTEFRSRRSDGSERWVLARGRVVRPPSGDSPWIDGVLFDITQRHRLTEEIQHAQRLESMGILAAGVAHEINNPLTYVLQNLESLRETPLGQDPLLAEAHEGAERIRQIVRDLKTFSRGDGETPARVDCNAAIEKAVRMAMTEIRYRARLVRDLGEIPMVLADEGKLAQVFLNLLINAAQAFDGGSPHNENHEIRIRTWEENGEVRAEVTDTGKGIPPEILPKIFHPFFTTKPSGVGTGLGLAVSRNILTLYGGRIVAESEVGRGARFLIALPAAPARGEAAPSDRSDTAPPTQRLRILVVDDEPAIRSAVSRILSQANDVESAESGNAALAILSRGETFDLILCDLMMPDLDGMLLHKALAARAPEAAERMVFMTGGAFTPAAKEFLGRVPNRRIEKPFGAKDLLRIAREVSEMRK